MACTEVFNRNKPSPHERQTFWGSYTCPKSGKVYSPTSSIQAMKLRRVINSFGPPKPPKAKMMKNMPKEVLNKPKSKKKSEPVIEDIPVFEEEFEEEEVQAL
jgi:hypothetical protein